MLAAVGQFGILDSAILAVYFILTLAIGLWSARKTGGSSKDFFVAEKSLPWWVVGFTMVAASISAEQMLGEVAYARDAGLVVSNWDLGVFPSLALMIFIFLPLYLRSGITTIPEYLERRYNKTVRLMFAGYTVFNNTLVALVMVMALGTKALEAFLGLPPVYGALLLAAFTGLYTVYGGMSSVAWTDTFQCVLLLAGGLLVFGVGLSHVPGGWHGLFERMDHAQLDHLLRGTRDPFVPWPGLLVLMLSTNVWYCCTNQFYVQSCLGAKDQHHGRLGILLTAFLAPVLTLCFAFPGYIANDLTKLGLLRPIEDANATYPLLVGQFLGPGLRGFLVAAVLGAIMSTVSSIVNATAGVYTMDLYKRWQRPHASDKEMILVGRLVGFATLLIATPLSLLVIDRQYIFTYSQNVWCILAIPITLVFTFGALWKRTTSWAATATFVFVLPFVAVPFLFGNTADNYLRFGFNTNDPAFTVHMFNFACLLLLAALAFIVLVSVLTRPPDAAAVAPYVWRPGIGRPVQGEAAYPWYRSVGFWSLIAGCMFVAIYTVYG